VRWVYIPYAISFRQQLSTTSFEVYELNSAVHRVSILYHLRDIAIVLNCFILVSFLFISLVMIGLRCASTVPCGTKEYFRYSTVVMHVQNLYRCIVVL